MWKWTVLVVTMSVCLPVRAGSGPDVIVSDIQDLLTWGTRGGITAFSIGTTSCNIGDEPLLWFRGDERHPVIAQNMYRLQDGRFEQIGQSWLKHGFFAVNGFSCGNCQHPFPDPPGSLLGVNCSDPYSASLNGTREDHPSGGGGLGPRSEVNPATGQITYPFIKSPPIRNELDRRLQVHHEDLEPNQNPGAIYFVEGQYVTEDDTAAGNGRNNGSHRQIDVGGSNGNYTISLTPGKTTQREQSAIMAWLANDSGVNVKTVDVDGDGRFLVGFKSSNNGDGTWHYEYAIYNYNSHRAAGMFQVPIPPDTQITNVGFHDVDSHTGDGEAGGVYSNDDWDSEILAEAVRWSTTPHGQDINANALRRGTLYNFRFDADMPPGLADATLGLFRPGAPDEVTVPVAAPGGTGGIPCLDVKKLKGKCKSSGTVKAIAKFRTTDHDGKSVTLRVDDRQFEVAISGKAAKLFVCCYNGPVEVAMLFPFECEDAIVVDCPQAP